MSMNLCLYMRKHINGVELDHEIPLRQTPTNMSYRIANDSDPLNAYFNWIRSIWDDEEEHIKRVQQQYDAHITDGYIANWEVF